MEATDDTLTFIKSEITRIKFVISDIQKRGIKAIDEYDVENGINVSGALLILNKDLEYFKNRQKELEEKLDSSKGKTGVELIPVAKKGGEVSLEMSNHK